MHGEFGEKNKFCWQQIYNEKYSSTFQSKCTDAQNIFKVRDPNEALRINIYFTRRTQTFLDLPNINIFLSLMGTFNWFDINFYSHSINEKNTSSFGKAVEMINSSTRGYHFKRSTSDNYLDLLLYLHLDKNNFEWTEVVGEIWSTIRHEYQIITDESNQNFLLSTFHTRIKYKNINMEN